VGDNNINNFGTMRTGHTSPDVQGMCCGLVLHAAVLHRLPALEAYARGKGLGGTLGLAVGRSSRNGRSSGERAGDSEIRAAISIHSLNRNHPNHSIAHTSTSGGTSTSINSSGSLDNSNGWSGLEYYDLLKVCTEMRLHLRHSSGVVW
jgi:hypothetical protein